MKTAITKIEDKSFQKMMKSLRLPNRKGLNPMPTNQILEILRYGEITK